MENATINPAPPNPPDLTWRPIGRADLAALVELSHTCHLADGGLGFLFAADALESRYFPERLRAAIGAFAPDERMVACAAVHSGGHTGTQRADEVQRATIVGQVLPDLRNRGIGSYLMQWSQVQARSLLAEATANQRVLQVSTEALTEPANRLYQAFGFECVFDELVMGMDLHQPVPERTLPSDVTLATWQPELAEQFYQAYYAAFKERPGFPGWSAAEWIGRVTEDDMRPEWTLLARVGGVPVGFVLGDADLTTDPPGGYFGQIGVIPAQRRRGLCSAMMVEAMRRMQAAGTTVALLTVHTNNPGAIQAYVELGFTTIGRRARYERRAEQ